MRKKIGVAVLGLVFVAFALRVYRLDFVSLRGDEAFTVIFVQRTWDALWKGISTIEPNPPLPYLALRVWVALAGAGEFATRYLSLWFGVLGVPLLYRLAREMFARPSVALFAAALLAINPYQVWHSQDVRNYTMWPSLSLVGLIFFWRWWKAEVSTVKGWNLRIGNLTLPFFLPPLTCYVLATLASLYTHYYDTFILAAVNVFVFGLAGLERRWRTLAHWVGAQVVLVLAYAPWVLFGTNRVTSYGEASAERGVELLDIISRTLPTLVLSDTVPGALKVWLWLPLAVALMIIWVWLARVERDGAAFLALCLGLPVVAIYIISIGRPLFLERYLNGIAPEIYLLFAVGLTATGEARRRGSGFDAARAVGAAGMLFFVLLSGYALANYYFDPAYAKAHNWRALMQFIVARREPGDIVVQNFTDDALSYYRNLLLHQGRVAEQQPGCDNPQGYLPIVTLPKDFWHTPADETRLRRLNVECARIWFIPSTNQVWDPDQFVEKFLARTDDRVINTRVGGYRLQAYLTPRAFEARIVPVGAHIGKATLVGYRVEGARVLRVVLYWRAEEKIEKDFTVFVHLADAGDRVIAQQDTMPVEGTFPTTQWQPGELIVDGYTLHVDAAPGAHTLFVGMYDGATLARVPAFDARGARVPDDRVWLTQVTVQ